ncbi:MAG: energy transducer TonB [Candidatus Latescibacterota bacterium]|nr:MAG: energy transducer TonB [Candidatus Latescibacterota bacterium]
MEPDRYIIVVEPPDDIAIPKPPADPAPPEIKVAAWENKDVPEDVLPSTSPADLRDLPIPPPPVTHRGDRFLAFEEPPVLIHFEAPVYPKLARQAGFEGQVLVIVLVGENGDELEATVTSSDVSPGMEQAALEAAKRCRFKPARQRTRPVRARVVVPFEFRLN